MIEAYASSNAYGEAKGGAGALGIAVAILEADASTTLSTSASLAGSTTLHAGGLDIYASTVLARATNSVVVGAGAIIASGGSATGRTTASAGSTASVGGGAHVVVTGGVVRVHADDNEFASTNVLMATGAGIAGGREADGYATVEPTVSASIGSCATVTATKTTPGTGNVTVEAISSAEGDVTAQDYGGALLGSGGSAKSTTVVEPSVFGFVGAGSTVNADGSFTLSSLYQRAGSPPSAKVLAIDGSLNTISVDPKLALRDGTLITYDAAIGSAALLVTASGSVGLAESGRLYNVLVLAPGSIQLGARFTGAEIDPLTDTIVFSGEHNLRTGDEVYLCQDDCIGSSFAASTRYVVKVIDSHTIKLTTGAEAAALSFNPATAVSGTTITFTGPDGFVQNQPVTYYAPDAAREFGSLFVDVDEVAGPSLATSGGAIVDDPAANNIFLPGTCNTILDITVCSGHGLSSGQRVKYQQLGGAPIGGLSDGGNYSVIAVDAYMVQLAVGWDSVAGLSFDPQASGHATITRTSGSWLAHGFADGQTITVSGASEGADNGTFTILHATDTVLTLTTNTLVCHTFLTFCIHDGNTVTVTTGAIALAPTKPTDPSQDSQHSITPVTDLPITGLVSGQTYYVQIDSGDPTHKISLANAPNGAPIALGNAGLNATHSLGTEAVDLGSTTTFTPTAVLASSVFTFATPTGYAQNEAVTYHASGTPITGLFDGHTYYVRLDGVDPTHKFQLAMSPTAAGTLTLDATGTTGLHSLQTTGLALGSATDAWALSLDLALAGVGSVTSDSLAGPNGADLVALLGGGQDGTSNSTAEGADGALVVAVQAPLANLTLSPTVRTCVGGSLTGSTLTCAGTTAVSVVPTTVTAGGNATISAQESSRATVYSDARAGAIIGADIARGKGTLSSTVEAEIGSHSVVSTGGNLSVTSTIGAWDASGNPIEGDDLTVQVVVAGGGVISVAEADASGVMTHTNLVRFGDSTSVSAGGNLAGTATSSLYGLVESTAFAAGGAVWSSADANHVNDPSYLPNGLQLTGSTTVHVEEGAELSGATVSLFSDVPTMHATSHAGAESFIVLLVGLSKSYADANVFINVTAQTLIDTGVARQTTITGLRGADIRSLIDDAKAERLASRLAVGIIPPQSAIGGACTVGNNSSGPDDSQCSENNANIELFTQHSTYATVDRPTVGALVKVGRNVLVTVGGRESNGPLVDTSTSDTRNPVALYVQSDVKNFSDNPGHWTLFTGIDGFYDATLSSLAKTAPIDWNADVVVLGGLDGSPYLAIAADGTVLAANAVMVVDRFGGDVTPIVGAPVQHDASGGITIAPISNSGYADILMTSNDVIANCAGQPQMASTKCSSTDAWPIFEFRDTLDAVTILNYSPYNLTVGEHRRRQCAGRRLGQGSARHAHACRRSRHRLQDRHDARVRPAARVSSELHRHRATRRCGTRPRARWADQQPDRADARRQSRRADRCLRLRAEDRDESRRSRRTRRVDRLDNEPARRRPRAVDVATVRRRAADPDPPPAADPRPSGRRHRPAAPRCRSHRLGYHADEHRDRPDRRRRHRRPRARDHGAPARDDEDGRRRRDGHEGDLDLEHAANASLPLPRHPGEPRPDAARSVVGPRSGALHRRHRDADQRQLHLPAPEQPAGARRPELPRHRARPLSG